MKLNVNMNLLLISILTIGFLCTPITYAGSTSKDVVSITEAESVASYFTQYISSSIDDFAEWNSATVERSTTYYDLDGEMSAYSFNVLNEGEYAGYIMISATKDNYPILGFSKGRLPADIEEITAVSDSLIQTEVNEKQLSIKKKTPIYLGGTFYYTQYSLADSTGNIVDQKLVDMTSPISPMFCNESVIEDLFGDEASLKKQQKIKEKEANEQWETMESILSGDFVPETVSTKSGNMIYGVPNYDWYIGCTPTSSAMVLGYWQGHGYSDFPLGEDLIEELASEMGTYNWPAGGTWPWDMDDGIEAVCENYDYDDISSSNDYTLSWTETKNEINNGRPFVLSMTLGGAALGNSQSYGQHSVACIGYLDGTYDYVILHDTWDYNNENYLAFSNWVAAMGTWVRP